MSSGFSYPQPIFQSPIYNPAFYLTLDSSGYLTYEYAQTLYLGKNDYRLSYISGITIGTATQGAALVPGANSDISGVGALSCSSLTVGGSAIIAPPSYVVGIMPGSALPSKALILDGSKQIAGINKISLLGTSTTAGAFETLLSISNADASPATADIQLKPGAAASSECFIGSTSASTKTVLMVGGARVITCEDTGNVSIGGTTTTYKLNLNGTVNCTNLYRSGVIADLTIISGITTIGTGQESKVLTLDASRNATNIASIACDIIVANTTTNILNINPTTLQIKGTTLTATATQLNVLNGFTGTTANLNVVSGTSATSADLTKLNSISATATELNYLDLTTGPGTAEINKALVLNSFGGISGINTLSTTGDITAGGSINGFLSYGNQSAITSVGSLTELGINSTPANEYFSIIGSGLDFLDGSYTRMLSFTGSNITPVKCQIEVHNGTNATPANVTWIGNYTNNDLRFGTNNSTTMILTTTNRLGVGTASPSAPLHISGSNNFVFGAGGTTVFRLRTDSGVTESALGPLTYSVAAIFGGYISCTAMAMTSDRRLKRNIQKCPLDRVKCLYDQCEVKLYDWIESENRDGQEVGLIAQDLISAHLTDLTSVFYRDDIEEGDDPVLEPAQTQLNVDYSRLSAYNMLMIQHLLAKIDELEKNIRADIDKNGYQKNLPSFLLADQWLSDVQRVVEFIETFEIM